MMNRIIESPWPVWLKASLIALVLYTWKVTNPSDPMRFVGATSKFRG